MTTVSELRQKRRHSRDVIIDLAERLYGQRGIDAVSLREISSSAGLANPASVHYHFGGRDELIAAIYNRRLPDLDAHRGKLLAEALSTGKPKMRALFDCLFRPLMEQRDEAGLRSYAAFLRQVLYFTPATTARNQAMNLTPITARILELLQEFMPTLPEALQHHRLLAANMLMLDVLVRHDADEQGDLTMEQVYADTLDILVSGMGSGEVDACSSDGRT